MLIKNYIECPTCRSEKPYIALIMGGGHGEDYTILKLKERLNNG